MSTDSLLTFVAVTLIIIAMVIVSVVVLVLRDRFDRRRWERENPPEKLAEERQRFVEELASPDWVFYERHLSRPVPEALRALFSEEMLRELHSAGGLVTGELLSLGGEDDSHLEPISEENLLHAGDTGVSYDIVPFARNIYGDPIYLRPGPFESNAVYVTYHDGGETRQIAEDVGALVRELRRGERVSAE